MNNQTKEICAICKRHFNPKQLTSLDSIRDTVFQKIKADRPEMETSGFICRDDLNHYRVSYVQGVLQRDKGELSELETQVIKSIQEHEILAKDISFESTDHLTFGKKIADKMAAFGGSWYFISFFGLVLICWIAVNGMALGASTSTLFLLFSLICCYRAWPRSRLR